MDFKSPYIFKKGQILKIKSLQKGEKDRYKYSSTELNIPSIIHLSNNLNEITGKILIGLFKILSYFGISRDPTEEISKNPSNWNRFFQIFEGGNCNCQCESHSSERMDLIYENNLELKSLSQKVDILINQDKEFIRIKINQIEKHLKDISGR